MKRIFALFAIFHRDPISSCLYTITIVIPIVQLFSMQKLEENFYANVPMRFLESRKSGSAAPCKASFPKMQEERADLIESKLRVEPDLRPTANTLAESVWAAAATCDDDTYHHEHHELKLLRTTLAVSEKQIADRDSEIARLRSLLAGSSSSSPSGTAGQRRSQPASRQQSPPPPSTPPPLEQVREAGTSGALLGMCGGGCG